MAQAKFTEMEMTTDQGVIGKYLEGEIMTRRDKLLVRLIQVKEDGACINSDDFTHEAQVKASYGEWIEAGAAWTKRSKERDIYYSVSLKDPLLSMSLWSDENAPGLWIANARNIRTAA